MFGLICEQERASVVKEMVFDCHDEKISYSDKG